jgi:hypothetical protein
MAHAAEVRGPKPKPRFAGVGIRFPGKPKTTRAVSNPDRQAVKDGASIDFLNRLSLGAMDVPRLVARAVVSEIPGGLMARGDL